jgi:hypothetical protein
MLLFHKFVTSFVCFPKWVGVGGQRSSIVVMAGSSAWVGCVTSVQTRVCHSSPASGYYDFGGPRLAA